jgi:FkbM family methyltransferase
MTLRRRLKELVEELAHIRIYRALPRGVDIAYDIATALPTYRADVVFDVGANVGQSTRKYLSWFPACRVFCFEPVRETYSRLQANLEASDRVHCLRVALGSSAGKGTMCLQGSSDRFFLASEPGQPPAPDAVTEEVDIITIDEFCEATQIQQISYLKIDTEGADLEVLRGAEEMLAAQRIHIVEVEAGMNRGNERHVTFETLKSHLEARGYFLFGIYEQMGEWPTREPHLRRANPVFISQHTIRSNRRGAGSST